MRRRTKKVVPTAEDLHPRHRLPDKTVRGADGKLISRGQVVRRLPHWSATLRAEVPGDRGRVIDIFTRFPDGRGGAVLQIERGRDAACGTAFMYACQARRSRAAVRGQTEETWNG